MDILYNSGEEHDVSPGEPLKRIGLSYNFIKGASALYNKPVFSRTYCSFRHSESDVLSQALSAIVLWLQ